MWELLIYKLITTYLCFLSIVSAKNISLIVKSSMNHKKYCPVISCITGIKYNFDFFLNPRVLDFQKILLLPPESWQSGRMRWSWKPLILRGIQGFESLILRIRKPATWVAGFCFLGRIQTRLKFYIKNKNQESSTEDSGFYACQASPSGIIADNPSCLQFDWKNKTPKSSIEDCWVSLWTSPLWDNRR